jgi:high-affinity nickel-transport protein
MLSQALKIFSDSHADVKRRLFGIYGVLAAINILAWIWAVVAYRHHPVLLGTALLAYGFGLRHAVDADHIAAIDNVTRKLMQEKKRPVTVGLFFSLGHSTVVVLASVAVAIAASGMQAHLVHYKIIGVTV